MVGWTLSPDAVNIWHDAPVDQLLDAQSLPVRLPLTQHSHPISLFSSLAVETCSCEAAADGSSSDQPELHDFAVDTVLYAGGPVWAMDWCPLHGTDAQQGPVNTTETLAISTHPKSQRRNPIGMQLSGPGVVQLWAVPSSMDCQLVPGGLPQLLALLWHEGRLAWDVQWCPNPAAFITTSSNTSGRSSGSGDAADAVPLQGLLAAVLGNGDVVIWAVPTIQYLLDLQPEAAALQQLAREEADMQLDQQQQEEQLQLQQEHAPCVSLQLQAIMQLPANDVGGSLASCCSWLPHAPHDQLLVGYWDGNVAIWKLPTTAGSAEPIQLLRADPTPVTAIAWQPNDRWWLTGDCSAAQAAAIATRNAANQQGDSQTAAAASSTSSSSSTQYFLTASNIGNLKVWDSQDMLAPCYERIISRNAINSCAWLGPPHVFVIASADGVLRCLWVDAAVQATSATATVADVSGSCGALWSLSPCVPLSVVAYVADGGLLGLMALEPATWENRHRKSHAAVSAVAVSEDQLWLLSAREIPGNGGLYANIPLTGGGNKKRAAEAARTTVVLDPLPHPDQVLHSVKFSPNYRGVVMLAYGGGAGIVRLHTMSAEVVPVIFNT